MPKTSSSPVVIAPDLSAYFEEVLTGAIRARRVDATDEAATYLVAMLAHFAHPTEPVAAALTRPLTFQLRDAMEAPSAERFQRLRSLGDHVLYVLGFFGGHLESKVDRGYVVGVGATAYLNAAAMLRVRDEREARRGVLSELATKFDRFVAVLRDIADGTLACGAQSERTIVRLYERWLATGSTRLAEELGAHGILAHKTPIGLA
ncbi:MAG TPA: hypothetical protein VGM56_11755 [Byssovorax sp.]